MSKVVEILAEKDFGELLVQDKPVLVDFWATWCGPCKMLSPIIDELAEERQDIIVGKVNVDDNHELATMFNVKSIPTLIVFKDGQEYARSLGYKPKNEILNMIG